MKILLKITIICMFITLSCKMNVDIPNEKDTYTVYLDTNGGTINETYITVPKNSSPTYIPTPIKTGEHFWGWYVDNNKFKRNFTEISKVTSDITIYAKWGDINYLTDEHALFSYNEADSSYTIIGNNDNISGDFTIPSTYNNGINGEHPVATIGDDAFSGFLKITNINIPSSITTIGDSAFLNCYGLTSLNIPSSVTSIGKEAFMYCLGLTNVSFPSSVTTIAEGVLSYCRNLENINIPTSITTIEKDAFLSCKALTSINIPSSVTSIGKSAFSYCESLTNVSIPSSVASIGYAAFSSCESLTNINTSSENSHYVSVNGVLHTKNKTELIQYPAGKTDPSYDILPDVTKIGSSAFRDCKNLTNIDIPVGVAIIGEYAFVLCKSLKAINLPTGTTTIEYAAFNSCSNLLSISLPDSLKYIDYNVFLGCNNLQTVYTNASKDSPPEGWKGNNGNFFEVEWISSP